MKNHRTSNESFVKVSEQLRNKGIKNYDFMLEIYDSSLLKVDPYSTKLDKETKRKIITEVNNNIWYYFREICRVKNSNGELVPFKLTKLTATMIYLFEKSRHQYVVGHRYSFKSHTANLLRDYGATININVTHLEDAEYIDNICERFASIYRYPKSDDDSLIILESIINDNDDNRHSKIRNFAEIWTDTCFDIPENELEDFYYVFYDYKEIVDNPEKFFKKVSGILNNDYDVIRREILCLRK